MMMPNGSARGSLTYETVAPVGIHLSATAAAMWDAKLKAKPNSKAILMASSPSLSWQDAIGRAKSQSPPVLYEN